MTEIIIFSLVILAFVVMAFWEAYAEGEHGGAAQTLGPKIKILGFQFKLYHLLLFGVFLPLLLSLPLVATGFNFRLFRFIVASYFLGIVVEDFLWFCINPKWPLKNFNSKYVTWYPWLKIGKLEIPLFYIPCIVIAGLLLFIF